MLPINIKRSVNLCTQCCLTLRKFIRLGGSHQGKSVLMGSHLSVGKGGGTWPQSKTYSVIKFCVSASGCPN